MSINQMIHRFLVNAAWHRFRISVLIPRSREWINCFMVSCSSTSNSTTSNHFLMKKKPTGLTLCYFSLFKIMFCSIHCIIYIKLLKQVNTCLMMSIMISLPLFLFVGRFTDWIMWIVCWYMLCVVLSIYIETL